MNLVQMKKSIAKLKRVRNIIGVSKFLTLQEISKATKISKAAFEVSILARDIFASAHKKYHLNLNYIKLNSKLGNLYIYISFPKSLLATSYDRIEKNLLSIFDKSKDKLITIGPIAEIFAKKNNINVIYKASDFNNSEIERISALTSTLFDEKKVGSVNYILQTNRNEKGVLTILPVTKLNLVELDKVDEYILSENSFYPSMVDAMINIRQAYVLHNTTAIFYEAKYFYLKEKLLRHEESISSIDERVVEKNKEIIKIQRKNQTEELILVSQNVKRNVGREKKNE